MIQKGFSQEFKKSAVQKLLNRGSRPVATILEEVGVSSPTSYQWNKEFANDFGMKELSKRPQERSATEKLQAIIEFGNLPETKRGEFLRRAGLHSDHIKIWKAQIEGALTSGKQTPSERLERVEERRKIKDLEKELRRKDKALAEATALLVFKKKRI